MSATRYSRCSRCCANAIAALAFEVVSLEEMSAADWQNFEATMKPNTDQMRMLGHYAVDTRRRSRRKREQS